MASKTKSKRRSLPAPSVSAPVNASSLPTPIPSNAPRISDAVELGSVPNLQNIQPMQRIPSQIVEIMSRADQEYVSGGQWPLLAQWIRSLPDYVDDLEASLGDDIYNKMDTDPIVNTSGRTLKLGMFNQGYQVRPKISKQEDPNGEFEIANELSEFLKRNFEGLRTPLVTTLWNMADSIKFGNKVAEKVYRYQDDGPDQGRLVLDRIKVKPRRTTAFVVDAFNNVVGLLALIPGIGLPVLQTLILDPSKQPNLLPRSKFCVLTNQETDENPAGISAYRTAYNGWFCKVSLWPEYVKYLTQFASGSIIGKTPEKVALVPALDLQGNTIPNTLGQPTMITAAHAMLAALLQVRNGSVGIIPAGAEAEMLKSSGEGEAFMSAVDLFDAQVEKGILGQRLATTEAKFGTRAQAGVHKDIFDMMVDYYKWTIEQMVMKDIVQQLVLLNFGAKYLHISPIFTLGDTAAEDRAALWAGLSQLSTSKYISEDQKPALDAMAGLPVRAPLRVVPDDPSRQPDDKTPEEPDDKEGDDGNKAAQFGWTAAFAGAKKKTGSEKGHWITVDGHAVFLGEKQRRRNPD